MQRLIGEKSAEVMGGLIPRFGREKNDFGILGQLFTELCELGFIVSAKEVLNTLNAEEFYVAWIDSFTLKHREDASNGSDDDMRPFLQSLPILVNVVPTHREVGGDG